MPFIRGNRQPWSVGLGQCSSTLRLQRSLECRDATLHLVDSTYAVEGAWNIEATLSLLGQAFRSLRTTYGFHSYIFLCRRSSMRCQCSLQRLSTELPAIRCCFVDYRQAVANMLVKTFRCTLFDFLNKIIIDIFSDSLLYISLKSLTFYYLWHKSHFQ